MDMKGLFCMNFVSSHSRWRACKSVWCGRYYTPPEQVKFYRHDIKVEGGFHWVRPRDASRHLSARDGEHLVTPFQCNLCMFWNLHKGNPGVPDLLLVECIHQTNFGLIVGEGIGNSSFNAERCDAHCECFMPGVIVST
jgi:hypothetical protein